MYSSWYLLIHFSMLFDVRQAVFFFKMVCCDWNRSTYPRCVMLNKNSFLSASYFDSTVFIFIFIIMLWYIMLLSIYLSILYMLENSMAIHASILLEKSHGQSSLVGYNPGVTRSQTWLSKWACTHTYAYINALSNIYVYCPVPPKLFNSKLTLLVLI